jgi:hypothetical protein
VRDQGVDCTLALWLAESHFSGYNYWFPKAFGQIAIGEQHRKSQNHTGPN